MQFRRPSLVCLAGPFENLGLIHHIRALGVKVGPERAEVAREDADVGRVDVGIDVVVAEVAVVALADRVRHRAESEQVVAGLEREPVFNAQTLSGFHLIFNRPHARRFGRHVTLTP